MEPEQVLEADISPNSSLNPQPSTQTHLSREHVAQYNLLPSAYYERYLSRKYPARVNTWVRYAAKRARQPLSTNRTEYIPRTRPRSNHIQGCRGLRRQCHQPAGLLQKDQDVIQSSLGADTVDRGPHRTPPWSKPERSLHCPRPAYMDPR